MVLRKSKGVTVANYFQDEQNTFTKILKLKFITSTE